MGDSSGMRGLGAVSAVMIVTALAGCSSYDSLVGTKPSAAASTSAASSSSSFSDRFSNFVLGSPATAGEGAGVTPPDIDCPTVEIRQGAATYAQSGPDNGSTALSLRYQANFLRGARECALRAGTVNMKVGVEGRVILGPAGSPGTLTLPVRLALVKEGVEPKTIWTKFYMVPVNVPSGESNVTFTHVEEDLSFPMPSAAELDAYVIYVGFDPDGAALEQKKKRPAKPAAKPKR
ncbi:MAG TPA: hypothetical protein VE909_12880 [Xanthobacteraceae bacterium]|nr:hypothetical protein [Xanthobacteraceae bacterium]